MILGEMEKDIDLDVDSLKIWPDLMRRIGSDIARYESIAQS